MMVTIFVPGVTTNVYLLLLWLVECLTDRNVPNPGPILGFGGAGPRSSPCIAINLIWTIGMLGALGLSSLEFALLQNHRSSILLTLLKWIVLLILVSLTTQGYQSRSRSHI